eukprot:4901541-Pleurochrysis_carterae.AAC.1
MARHGCSWKTSRSWAQQIGGGGFETRRGCWQCRDSMHGLYVRFSRGWLAVGDARAFSWEGSGSRFKASHLNTRVWHLSNRRFERTIQGLRTNQEGFGLAAFCTWMRERASDLALQPELQCVPGR